MAPSRKSIAQDLHARGLRKKSARTVADALTSPKKTTQKTVARVADDLKRAAAEIEDRAAGGPAKRQASARKAANTRARKAKARSDAAKKGARTRAQKS